MKDLFLKLKKTSDELRVRPLVERAKKLKELSKTIVELKDEINDAINKDFGKNSVETDLTEIMPALTEINNTLKNIESWGSPTKVSTPLLYTGTNSYLVPEPKGVCLIISPWNYPFQLAINPLIPAVAAGNAVVLKPSEFTPHVSAIIKKVVEKVFDHNEVSVIEGGVEVSQQLLELPFDHIFFTGSTQVGRHVMAAAAKHLSSVTLELGGKSPAIIDDSADLAEAAKKIAWGKWVNAGQTCIAPDYILISKKKRDEFVGHLKNALNEMYSSSWNTDYAQIVSDKHYERLVELRNEAINQGAKDVCSFDQSWKPRQLAPSILIDVPWNSKVMTEEIFGPLLPVVTADTPEEKIGMAKYHPNPLALYIFAKSTDTVEYFQKRIPSGGVCVNDTLLHIGNHHLPFGGRGASGIGKYHGEFGFYEFSHLKGMMVRKFNAKVDFFYPPYTAGKKNIVSTLLRKLSSFL